MTECYNCGQEGHRRQDCPSRAPLPPAAPQRAAEPWQHPGPPPDPAITGLRIPVPKEQP